VSGSRRKLVVYLATSWIPHAVAYVIAPLAVSRLGRGAGSRRRPNPTSAPTSPRLAGLPLLAGGAGLILSAIVSHYRSSSDEIQVTPDPDYLATDGVYAHTRNPFYLGGALMWTGWSVLLASPPVAVAGAVLVALLAAVGVPFEERRLAAKFGEAYEDYRRSVPRWTGRP
jgi:protein-S-isoprenylcysteine O-methyltransferase Ste14